MYVCVCGIFVLQIFFSLYEKQNKKKDAKIMDNEVKKGIFLKDFLMILSVMCAKTLFFTFLIGTQNRRLHDDFIIKNFDNKDDVCF